MKKKGFKLAVIISAACVILGIFFLIIGVTGGGRPGVRVSLSDGIQLYGSTSDAGEQSMQNVQAGTVQNIGKQKITEDFTRIDVTAVYGEVRFVPSSQAYVQWQLPQMNAYAAPVPEITVKDGCLTVSTSSNNNSGFNVDWTSIWQAFKDDDDRDCGETWIEIGVPAKITYDKITAVSDSGDMSCTGLNFKEAEFSLSFGEIDLHQMTASKLKAETSSGDIEMENCQSEDASLKTSFGSIDIEGGSIEILCAQTDSGDVTVSQVKQLTDTQLYTSFGEVEMDTGEDADAYTMTLSTSFGNINVYGRSYDNGEYSGGNGSKMIKIETGSGDIRVSKQDS